MEFNQWITTKRNAILKKGNYLQKNESEKVFKILKNFNTPGINDFSGIFLKDGASLLATSITLVCNLSISSGIFPDTCKIANLKPLFKKGSKTDPKNYPPISPLPHMSKVLERIVHEQIMEFLDQHNIFDKTFLLTFAAKFNW